MIKFHCKNCGKKISVPEKHAGKKGKCPKCKNIVVVPKAEKIVSFKCSMCNEEVKVPETSKGKLLECPNCGCYAEVPAEQEQLEKNLSYLDTKTKEGTHTISVSDSKTDKNFINRSSSLYNGSKHCKVTDNQKKMWIVIYIGMGLLMIAALYFAQKDHKKISRLSESIEATIVSTEIEQRVESVGGGRTRIAYQPIIQFEYKLGDRTYLNKDYPEGPGIFTRWSNHGSALELLKKYPVGATIQTYYNPTKTSESVVIRKHFIGPYFFMGFIVLLFLLSFLLKWGLKHGWVTVANRGRNI